MLLLFVCFAPAPALAAPKHRAGVLVRNSDGEWRKMCVPFDENTITGEQLLRRTGLEIETKSSELGTSVCKIGSTGCSSSDCYCGKTTFWGYWTQDPKKTKWTFSQVGPAQRTVRDGALDAWVWGKDGKPVPPKQTIGSVCTTDLAAQASVPAKRGATTRGNAVLGFVVAAVLLAAAGGIVVWRRVRE
jgi:hypothetical protein